ncbi:MAG TPA: TIGR01777 family oxidoreductase [Isosphaeraceae bacterium]|jgi:hypothetical protein
MAMRVFLTGGTGLIGRRLVQRLVERGDEPVILSRRADEVRREKAFRSLRFVQGDPTQSGAWEEAIDGCDAVINLAGHNLFSERWNERVKHLIRDSRVHATERVVKAIAEADTKPKVLVQASAIGYYGPHGDEELTEDSPAGSDFLARVCREWEQAAAPDEGLGVRVAKVRTGLVLAKDEGPLGVMTPIFKWVPGGAAPVGSGDHPLGPGKGEQWMSWIHVDDIVGIFLLALDNPAASGPINGTAPNPVRNIEFSRALAKTLWRPMLPIGPPDFGLRALLGEVADVVTKGQKVLPARALSLGYRFQYPNLPEALQTIFAKVQPEPEPARPKAHGNAHAHH